MMVKHSKGQVIAGMIVRIINIRKPDEGESRAQIDEGGMGDLMGSQPESV
ncbi:MAG: hypothetical protein AB9903_28715 [Vulcanimicrobiota bacterium]